MKYFRLFACLSALMAATCAFSQKSGKDVVVEKFMVADSLMKIAEKTADYSAAYKAYTAVIKAYDRLSEAERKIDRKYVGSGIYYNAASVYGCAYWQTENSAEISESGLRMWV